MESMEPPRKDFAPKHQAFLPVPLALPVSELAVLDMAK